MSHPKLETTTELMKYIEKEGHMRVEKYESIIRALSQSKKSLSSQSLSFLTGVKGWDIERRLEELEKLGVVRKTTAKTVKLWGVIK